MNTALGPVSRIPRGFTLVELMISMALGLFLTVIISYAYLGSRQVFRTTEALSRIQENARYAFERIANDFRMTGFTGCSFNTVANVVNNPSDWQNNLFGAPLQGYKEGVSTFPGDISANLLRGDALSAVFANNSKDYLVSNHNPTAASITLTANHDIKQGEILVITDCQHAAVFQMTNANVNNTIAVVDHGVGNSVSPGNCTKGFGNPVPSPCTANGTPYTFAPGSHIFRLNAVTYFLRNNPAGEPALFRQKLGASGGNAVTTAEEMAEGVEDMQILYGEDTAGTDQTVDAYVAADAVGDWSRVRSVRIAFSMVSRADENLAATTNTKTYGNGTTVTDRLLHKTYSFTIAIRNRLL